MAVRWSEVHNLVFFRTKSTDPAHMPLTVINATIDVQKFKVHPNGVTEKLGDKLEIKFGS